MCGVCRPGRWLYLRERIWRATCWGLVKVELHTGHCEWGETRGERLASGVGWRRGESGPCGPPPWLEDVSGSGGDEDDGVRGAGDDGDGGSTLTGCDGYLTSGRDGRRACRESCREWHGEFGCSGVRQTRQACIIINYRPSVELSLSHPLYSR